MTKTGSLNASTRQIEPFQLKMAILSHIDPFFIRHEMAHQSREKIINFQYVKHFYILRGCGLG